MLFAVAGCESAPRPEVPRPTLPGGRALNDHEIYMVGWWGNEVPDSQILTAASLLFEDKKPPEDPFGTVLDVNSPLVFEVGPLVSACRRYFKSHRDIWVTPQSPEHDTLIRELRELLRRVGIDDVKGAKVFPLKGQEQNVESFLARVKEVNTR